MNIKNTDSSIVDLSQGRVVRTAGFMFLFSFIVPALNYALVLSKFIVPGNNTETARNIMVNETLFRFGITVELIMSAGLVILAVVLFSILKSINRNLARLGLSLKLVEAALSSAIVLVSFIAVNAEGNLVGVVLNAHTALYAVPMVFLGLDMTIFCYLFLKSKYIPWVLAGFGIISFLLILIHSLMYLMVPDIASMPINQIVFYGPSGLFEIITGTWLLSKGINLKSQEI